MNKFYMNYGTNKSVNIYIMVATEERDELKDDLNK